LVFISGFTTLNISVFNPEDVGASALPGKEPVEERGAGVANMQLACRRGRKSYADFGFGRHAMMLAEEPKNLFTTENTEDTEGIHRSA
jgi:hypothetical protein